MTKYEKAVYDLIATSHEHLTVNQVYERLKANYPKVVLATVYNNLNRLWMDGFVRKIAIEGMPDQFDSVQKTYGHFVR